MASASPSYSPLPMSPPTSPSATSSPPSAKGSSPSSPSSSIGAAPIINKAEEIRILLSQPQINLWKLRELAITEGGLVNDSLRKLAWPKLVSTLDYYNNQNNLGRIANVANKKSSSSAVVSSPTAVQDFPSITQTLSTTTQSLDYAQIEKDVSRVTWHLLTGNQRSLNFQMKNKHRKRISQLLRKKQRRLGDYINLVLLLSYYVNPNTNGDDEAGDMDESEYVIVTDAAVVNDEDRLRYYQGFHDIASIILSAIGGTSISSMATAVSSISNHGEDNHETSTSTTSSSTSTDPTSQAYNTTLSTASSMGLHSASLVLLRLTQSHLRDAMRPNFHQLQSALKLIIMPLIATFDPQLHSHLYDCEMEPYFCLSWIITWFSHDVRDTALVKRLFDFFIVSHPLMSVYMSIAMIIHPLNRIEILGTDCDFACVHNALADLPKNSSNVGWKYIPGDNPQQRDGQARYVTGNESELDDVSCDTSLQDGSIDDGSVISLDGSVSRSRAARVPFQELIDLSISLMRKIPPRNLLNLAQRYHDEITLQPLMAQSSSIALLQPPPSFGLTSYMDSDWVIRQKSREENGTKKKLNRHQRKQRKNLLKQVGSAVEPSYSSSTSAAISSLENIPSPQAIIASGTGPDGRAEARAILKKRRMMIRSVIVVILAVLVALGKSYFYPGFEGQEQAAVQQPSSPTLTSPTKQERRQQEQQKPPQKAREVPKKVTPKKEEAKLESNVSESAPVADRKAVVDRTYRRLMKAGEDAAKVEEDEPATGTSKLTPIQKRHLDSLSMPPKAVNIQPSSGDEAPADNKSEEKKKRPIKERRFWRRCFRLFNRHNFSDKVQTKLNILVKKLVLFVKKLMDVIQIGWHETRVVWSKIGPGVADLFKSSCRNIKMASKKISNAIEEELTYEIDGGPKRVHVEWMDDAKMFATVEKKKGKMFAPRRKRITK